MPNFIEVYVDSPLKICIEKDTKNLHKKALSNEIYEFTGISSPYEIPKKPDLTLRTHEETIAQCVARVLEYLYCRGFIPKY